MNIPIERKVSAAILLDREISEKTEELKKLKADLSKAADAPGMEKIKTEGGGWSVEIRGLDGSICRVTQPGRKLKASLDPKGKPVGKLTELLKGEMFQFLRSESYLVPVEDFRDRVDRLPTAVKNKVLKLMTVNSKPTVSFETKEPA